MGIFPHEQKRHMGKQFGVAYGRLSLGMQVHAVLHRVHRVLHRVLRNPMKTTF